MFTIRDAAALVRAADDILIVCHIRPDGDAAGSAGALCMGLRTLGKRAFVAPHEHVMERFEAYIRPYFAPEDFAPRFLVSVDTPGTGQYPPGLEALAERTDLALDHHGSNSRYAAQSYIEPESASCGELVYALLGTLGVKIDATMAEALYCAISTDTGCFRTRGTTARCMEIAARLRETGFDAFALTHRLFDVKSAARLRLEAAIYGAMRYPRPDTATVIVSKEMLAQCGVREDDLDKISILTTAAEGVRVGLMLRELADGSWKVSVRTDGSIPAGAIAGIFPGGGGHPDSGGAVAGGDPEALMARMLARAEGL